MAEYNRYRDLVIQRRNLNHKVDYITWEQLYTSSDDIFDQSENISSNIVAGLSGIGLDPAKQLGNDAQDALYDFMVSAIVSFLLDHGEPEEDITAQSIIVRRLYSVIATNLSFRSSYKLDITGMIVEEINNYYFEGYTDTEMSELSDDDEDYEEEYY